MTRRRQPCRAPWRTPPERPPQAHQEEQDCDRLRRRLQTRGAPAAAWARPRQAHEPGELTLRERGDDVAREALPIRGDTWPWSRKRPEGLIRDGRTRTDDGPPLRPRERIAGCGGRPGEVANGCECWPSAGPLLLAPHYWPPTTGRLLLAAGYWPRPRARLPLAAFYFGPTAGRVSLAAYWRPPAPGRPWPPTGPLLLTVCSPPTARRLLLAALCRPLAASCLLPAGRLVLTACWPRPAATGRQVSSGLGPVGVIAPGPRIL